jgi:hypothetical protein
MAAMVPVIPLSRRDDLLELEPTPDSFGYPASITRTRREV